MGMDVEFKLSELIMFFKEEGIISDYEVKEDHAILGFSSVSSTSNNTLTWIKRCEQEIEKAQNLIVICPHDTKFDKNTPVIFIPVSNPRKAFIRAIQRFYPTTSKDGIERTAIIGRNCSYGKNVYIGHNTVIGDNVSIGDNTKVYSNVSIYNDVEMGMNCLVHSGAVIGSDGFGFEIDGSDIIKFPHIGKVVIGNNVEIGSNTTIDRGPLSDTVLKDNVKLDNLCQIGHGVIIGENTLIAGMTVISGSVKIGKRCWLAPGVVLMNGINIGDNAYIGLGAVVLKDVGEEEMVAGVPARPLERRVAD